MRTIKYSDLLREKMCLYRFRALNKKRLARSRPRDPAERETLLKMDIARRKKYIKDGRLVILSPRVWKLVV